MARAPSDKEKIIMLRLVAASLFVLSLAASSFSQTVAPSPSPPTQAGVSAEVIRGIELYRQGNMRAAIEALRAATRSNRNDADAWHYLGLALNRQSETRDARRAFQQAVRLRPDFAAARTGWAYTFLVENKLREAERESRRALQLDSRNAEAHYILGVVHYRRERYSESADEARAALTINGNFAAAHLLKSQALIASIGQTISLSSETPDDTEPNEQRRAANQQYYNEAADGLERYISLTPNAPDVASLREQLEAVRFYARVGSDVNAERSIFWTRELSMRVRILYKPAPPFTEEARRNGVSGMVVLRALFSSDGTVRYIFPIRSVGYGLTEAAIRAARQIRFEPATINGRPVATFVVLQYSFNVR